MPNSKETVCMCEKDRKRERERKGGKRKNNPGYHLGICGIGGKTQDLIYASPALYHLTIPSTTIDSKSIVKPL